MTNAKIAVVLSLVVLSPLLLAHSSEAESRPPAPAGLTYFTILLGLDGELPAATCLEFRGDKVCASNDLCGEWRWITGQNRRQGSFSFDLALVDDEGTEVRVDGVGRIDRRGRGNTIAAAARAWSGREKVNFGLVGRPSDPATCADSAREFNRLVEDFVE